MSLQQFSGRSWLFQPIIGAWIILFLLLREGYAASHDFLTRTASESEPKGLLRARLGRENFLLNSVDNRGFNDDGPVFETFASSSSPTLLVPTLGAAVHSRKLVGWFLSSWKSGACQNGQVTEHMVKEAARLAGGSSAYLRGMRYFAIDSCWLGQQQRNPGEMGGHSEIEVDRAIFPRGVAPLAQSVQDEGLVFGLGLSVSSEKCSEIEPSPLDIEEIELIHTLSNWGVEFLKLNSCGNSIAQAVVDFRRWSEAARASSSQPSLLCTWTNMPRFHGDPKLSELADLCDVWVSPQGAAKGWQELKEEVDRWLLSQQHSSNKLPDVPLFTLKESDVSSNDAIQTELALAVRQDSVPIAVPASSYPALEGSSTKVAGRYSVSLRTRLVVCDDAFVQIQAVLGSQLVMRASNSSTFSRQGERLKSTNSEAEIPVVSLNIRISFIQARWCFTTKNRLLLMFNAGNLIQDEIFLAAISDPAKGKVQRSSGIGNVDVLARQLADGDYVVALINWGKDSAHVSPSHADMRKWCSLQKPVSLKVRQAWNKDTLHTINADGHALDYVVQSHGTVLLQVELTDDLPESQEALILSDKHTALWSATTDLMFPAMDVLHHEGKPPAFTAGSRFYFQGSEKQLGSFKMRHVTRNTNSGGDETASSFDTLFKTVFSLLLPIVASTLEDTPTKRKGKKHHHHKHHRHAQHKDHVEEQHNHDGHIHVASVLQRSTADRALGAVPAESRMEVLSYRSLPETTESFDSPQSSHSGGAGWILITGLALLVCIAIVAAWRTLLVRKIRTNTWKNVDTQLVERPHVH